MQATIILQMLASVLVEVARLCRTHNIPADHGLEHVLCVTGHVARALACRVDPLPPDRCDIVLVAAALHDVDDRKFFPANTNYENARAILDALSPMHDPEEIIEMISLVSCSSNGNDIDTSLPDYYYYPRHADRIAACGAIGVARCREYTLRKGAPLSTPDTFRATSRDDLYTPAMLARFEAYTHGGAQSASMIDHFYDKLLHLSTITGNPYFDEQLAAGQRVLEDFVLEYGRKGAVV